MNHLSSYVKRTGGYLLALLSVAASTVCCDAIFDDEGDCSVTYRVKFLYDRNMKFADAFAREVKSVTLYAVDEHGTVVWQGTERGEALAAEDYAMTLDVAPGSYELIAWCGQEQEPSFVVSPVSTGETAAEDMTCRLVRDRDAGGRACVKEDLQSLFFGSQRHTFPDEAGVHVAEVPLMKNTNNIRVVLQHLSGEPVDKDKFTFSVTDENGLMDWQSRLLPDEQIDYYAWSVEAGSAGVELGSRTITSVSATVAELTVGRLVKGNDARLVVRNDAGDTVLSIPLIDYALLVKGNYNREMDDQEYLDRQDEYSMVFFLDENDRWVDAFIYINSWKIVLQQTGL